MSQIITKSNKDVVKGVLKKTAPAATSGTDPSDPWSAKAEIAENVTSNRADLLQKFYKSKGWNVDYITKNKKVAQSKTNDFIKWKNDHGYFEEVQPIEELSTNTLSKYKTAASKQASELDKAGGKANIEKANKRFGGIVKATHKQFANDSKQENTLDPQAATEAPSDGANTPETTTIQKSPRLSKIVKEAHSRRIREDMYDHEKDEKSTKPYGKPPSSKKIELSNNDDDDQKVNARMVLQGGTTLTGKPRDVVQIDPMLRQRLKVPDYKRSKPEQK